jgi:hypothetical protein
MFMIFKNGQGAVILRVKLRNSSVAGFPGLIGLTSASANLKISTIADAESVPVVYAQSAGKIETIAALGTFVEPTATKCRFKEVDSANLPGLYEIQLSAARFAVSNARSLHLAIMGATNLLEFDEVIPLWILDPYGMDLFEHDAYVANQLSSIKMNSDKIPEMNDGYIEGTVAASPAPTVEGFRATFTDPISPGNLMGSVITFRRPSIACGGDRPIMTIDGDGDITVSPNYETPPAAGDTFVVNGRISQ